MGRFSIMVWVMTWPTSEVLVWTSGTSPVTVMASATPPTFIVKSTVEVLPTWTVTPWWTCVEKPERSTETSYLPEDRKSTRLNSSHSQISYAVFCLKKKNKTQKTN